MAKPKKRAPRAGAVVPLRLSDDELAWLDAEAKRLGSSRNDVIRNVLGERRARSVEARRREAIAHVERLGFVVDGVLKPFD